MNDDRGEAVRGVREPDRTWSYVAVLALEAVVVLALWALGRHFSG